MTQPSLLDLQPRFDSGVELTKADHVRLGAQLQRVLDIMSDGKWRSVDSLHTDIRQRFGVLDPVPSLSAQLRNARKAKHGSHDIQRMRQRGGNVYLFRLVQP